MIRSCAADQTGSSACPSASRTAAPPSNGSLKRPGPCSSFPPVTIHLPSGDHDEVPRMSMSSLSIRGVEPSVETSASCCLPCFLRTSVAQSPAGEIAAGSNNGPSEPFQISVTAPRLNRDRPSARPLDDRKYNEPSGPNRGAHARSIFGEYGFASASRASRSRIGIDVRSGRCHRRQTSDRPHRR
jgi:hypothetical protein